MAGQPVVALEERAEVVVAGRVEQVDDFADGSGAVRLP
jgi:hypothetical protein